MSEEKPPQQLFTQEKEEKTEYVTVVTVGTDETNEISPINENKIEEQESGYVTVLQIGDSKTTPNEIIEEVLVYRLPGERLGFGLKFEGGTKAAENVKRLFIQSCAPDSPASMVHCSWGKLTEGDEVLNIDSLPVTCMTRMDCVRCLKDSELVIKLLVRHLIKVVSEDIDNDNSARTEDLPHVISAEKKRTPPPPPPVPPRKIPRKLLKEPPPQENQPNETNGIRGRFQSPRNSGKFGHFKQSPEVSRRLYKDGNGGPPDAEVYLDLFSLEPGCNLSESDDTGSSISTIIDRFGSYPTTTNSSIAGSLPSTPTFIQKQLLNSFNNDELDAITNKNYLFSKFTSQDEDEIENVPNVKTTKNNKELNEDEQPLQPPTSFQDAPLSYGTEKVGVVETNNKTKEKNNYNLQNGFPKIEDENGNCLIINKGLRGENCDNDLEELELPRLVHLVPKSSKTNDDEREDISDTISALKLFLDNETRFSEELLSSEQKEDYNMSSSLVHEIYNNSDLYNHSWNLSTQLDTIGEVDEEGCQDIYFQKSIRASTPIVIIENTDAEKCELDQTDSTATGTNLMLDEEKSEDVTDKAPSLDTWKEISENMESPPISSNQEKKREEFVDYYKQSIRTKLDTVPSTTNSILWKTNSGCLLFRDQQSSCSFRDKLAFFSNSNSKSSDDLHDLLEKDGGGENILAQTTPSIKSNKSEDESSLSRAKSSLDLHTQSDCSSDNTEETDKPKHLHVRSQSLMDITSTSLQCKKDKWFALAEQRQRSLSKLKGLVIPERVVEVDVANAVDLPEIKSDILATLANNLTLPKLSNEVPILNFQRSSISNPTPVTPWINNVSKYSPTFKQKFAPLIITKEKGIPDKKLPPESLFFGDAPKSLESITSPTRSDCSFEYVNGSDLKASKGIKSTFGFGYGNKKKEKKSEDESDNDSAVSSSQSSYISRTSPPMSPKPRYFTSEMYNNDPDSFSQFKCSNPQLMDNQNHRLLKAQSVEAINRKNILASAKCRSGQDLKVGSPLIQKKLEEDQIELNTNQIEADFDKVQNLAKKSQTNGNMSFTELVKPNKNNDKDEITEKENVQFLEITKSKKADSKELIISNLINSNFDTKNSFFKPLSKKSSTSVTDLRKTFEKLAPTHVNNLKNNSSAIKDKQIKKNSNNKSSPTIKQEIKVKSENKSKGNFMSNEDSEIVVLCPQIPGGSVGITLAGGSDYENKNITVYKIREESSAHRDGRLKKGDRILAINNTSVEGLTHKQLVALLKEPLPEVTLAVCKTNNGCDTSIKSPIIRKTRSCLDLIPTNEEESLTNFPKKAIHIVSLVKDAAGLGLSLEGGQDSPLGNMPLQIKKIFKGGVAEKCENLKVGDELLIINEIDVSSMSRFQAWSVLKKLPEGESISLTVKR